jgi:hypothetical protein
MNDSRGVNLIPRARRLAKARRRRLRHWAAILGAYSVLVIVGVVVCHAALLTDRGSLQRQLELVNNSTEKSRVQIKSLSDEMKRARAVWRAAHAVGEQPDWSLLLAMLSKSVGDQVVLRTARLHLLAPESRSTGSEQPRSTGEPAPARADAAATDPSRSPENRTAQRITGILRLELSGLGRSQTAVTDFVLHLEQLGLFDRARLMETRREPFLDSQAVAFRIECLLRK